MQLTLNRQLTTRAALAVRIREATLFQIGIAFIALHVIDDRFLQPEPDVYAGDHLVSGLVPLVLLTIAALSYARLRPALRATLALLIGALGVTIGITEAAYYTREVGPSGDDYTGLLAIPAGIMLIGLGFVVLWRMRQFKDSRIRRYLRRSAFAAAGAVIAFVLLPTFGTVYVLTHSQRAIVPEANLGAPHEGVSFTTSDGVTLAGWYVPSTNGATIIVYPGRTGTRDHARMLIRHGYGVLLFDRRGEGESTGDPNPWAGNLDLNAALTFLRARPDVDPNRIGGLGLSVGGELLLQTAAENDMLKAVVSEGAGVRSMREQMERMDDRWWETPIWLILSATMPILADQMPPPNLMDLVGKIAPRPIFLIYAENGQGGEDLNPAYFAAAGESKLIWEITVGKHMDGIEVLPEEYERRVIGFLDWALPDGN